MHSSCPRRTPQPIIQRLNRATVAALEMPSLQQRLKQVGGDVIAPERRSPEYLAQFLAAETRNGKARLRRVAFHSDRVDRMRFTCPCCPYPAHLARRAMHESTNSACSGSGGRWGASGCADLSFIRRSSDVACDQKPRRPAGRRNCRARSVEAHRAQTRSGQLRTMARAAGRRLPRPKTVRSAAHRLQQKFW